MGELGELGVLEVQVEVQIRGGHECSLDSSSCLMVKGSRRSCGICL